MLTYQEGDLVALAEDKIGLGLKAGSEGIVWAVYDLPVPTYEVTFRSQDGQALDLTVSEQEITTSKTSLVPSR